MREASVFARRLLVWIVPFAIVVAVLGFETDWGRSLGESDPARVAATGQPVAVALLPEYRIDGGIDSRRETVDRVLFNPTRRPAPPATPGGSTAPSTMKRGQYALTGTTVVGNVATAFLREINGGKSHTVRRGETLEGLLVAEVAPDHVKLKQGDETEDLTLKIAAGPRTTVQPAVVTSAPPAQPGAPQPGTARPAVPAQAGGTPAPVQGQPAPPPPGTPGAAARGQQASTPASVSQILAERRRAARAAAEAAAAGRSPVTPAQPR